MKYTVYPTGLIRVVMQVSHLLPEAGRRPALLLLSSAVFGLSAFGQPAAAQSVDRTLELNAADSVQAMQEIATLVRGISGMQQVNAETEQRVLVVRGTADQIALTEWLVKELDQPANVAEPVKRKYEMAASADRNNVVSVFYLPHTDTVQNLQEVGTVVRMIGDIRRLFLYNGRRAMVARGTPEQIDLAEWLVPQLDQPATAAKQVKLEYIVPGPGDPDNVVRLFALRPGGTEQRLQEIATEVRTTTQVRRLFTYSAPRIITLRGTPGQVEQANQMIGALDR